MARSLAWLAWPAFLAASVLELLVFAFVDPHDLRLSGEALGWSRQAVYTGAFFAFWLIAMGACVLAALLRAAPDQVNHRACGDLGRPTGPG